MLVADRTVHLEFELAVKVRELKSRVSPSVTAIFCSFSIMRLRSSVNSRSAGRAHAQQQLLVTYRFNYEVAGSDIDGIFIRIILGCSRSSRSHRHGALLTIRVSSSPPQPRHFDVRDHDVKKGLFDQRQGGLGAAGRFGLKPRHAQVLAKGIADIRFVINNQDALPHDRRFPKRQPTNLPLPPSWV